MKAYQFKISLKRCRPPIWRRILIPACMSFEDLAEVIQDLFGFTGFHLDEFRFTNPNIVMLRKNDPDSWEDILIMGRHSLESFEGFKRFRYTYDFGDDWEFEVVREKIDEDYPDNYPVLRKYKGDNLVEDCGGVWGYQNLLEAWEKPGKDDAELLEWAGNKEDYEFDAKAAGEQLKSFTCDKDGRFIMRDGLDEEEVWDDEGDDEDLTFEDILKDADIEGLKKAADKTGISGFGLLLDIMKDPKEGERLINGERMPKNEEEMKLAVSLVTLNVYSNVVLSINEHFGIPIDEIVDALDLSPEMGATLKLLGKRKP